MQGRKLNIQLHKLNNQINHYCYLHRNNFHLAMNKQKKLSKLETGGITLIGWFVRSIDDQKMRNNGIDLCR